MCSPKALHFLNSAAIRSLTLTVKHFCKNHTGENVGPTLPNLLTKVPLHDRPADKTLKTFKSKSHVKSRSKLVF